MPRDTLFLMDAPSLENYREQKFLGRISLRRLYHFKSNCQLCRPDPCVFFDYLKSIPGFGPYVSAVTLAAIGNADRFENRSQLLRLAGFDLSANRSGEKSRTAVPVISKKGKANLRYALYQAALVASSRTSHFRAYYNRLLEGRQREKGIRTKMLVKIAAKMLVIAWTLMKRKESFNPVHIQT